MRVRVDEAEKPELKLIDNEKAALDEEVYVLEEKDGGNVKCRPSIEIDMVDLIVEDASVTDTEIEETWGIRKEVKSSLIGWLILSLLIIGAAITWLFVSEADEDVEIAESSLLGNDVITVLDKQEELEPAELVNSLFENISAYFAAESISEKLRFVRHPDRVKVLMEEYYGQNEIKTKDLARLLSQSPATLDYRLYNGVFVEMADGSKDSVLVELLDGGDTKIDWEVDVCYLPVPWDEYIEKRPVGSFRMRVYVQKVDYYAYEFSDDEKYTSYQLTTRDFDGHLYAYALNDSKAGQKINAYMNKVKKKGQKGLQSMLLDVSFPRESTGLNQLVIDELVAVSWVYSKPLTKKEGK